MTKEQVINIVSKKIRLIRIEKNYTQAKMAEIIGISKKLLFRLKKEE